jgi:multidrug efflux pump subunit AcrB
VSGGFLHQGAERAPLRTAGYFEDPAQIGRQPMMIRKDGGLVNIEHIAEVSTSDVLQKETTRFNGKPLVTVAVFRAGGADLRSLWKETKKALKEIEADKPDAPRVHVIYSQAEELEKVLGRLKRIIILSAGAAGIVLFLFLGCLSSTLIVVASIPFSLLTAVLFMFLLRIPLDIYSMSGLILAAGVLVDNAIVVLESVSRKLQAGLDRPNAIIRGAEGVVIPILFSTLTTVMVFLPLTFVSPEIRIGDLPCLKRFSEYRQIFLASWRIRHWTYGKRTVPLVRCDWQRGAIHLRHVE